MQFEVGGMTCGHCAGAVRDAIRSIDAQAVVDVDLAKRSVDVASARTRDELTAAIRSAGYTTA